MPDKVKEKRGPKLLLHMSYHTPSAAWGKRRALHSHDFCEIMFVREGEGEVVIGNQSHPISSGDIVVYNPGTMHTELLYDEKPRCVMFLGISNLSVDGLEPGSLCKGQFAVIPTGSSYSAFCFYLDQLETEKEMKNSQSSPISKSLLNIIISYVVRLSEETENAFESKKTYAEIKKHLDEHYTEIDTIDGLCKDLFINKYYLTHLFKDAYGIPPLQYVIKKRMALAKHLLVNTDLRVDEISAHCGYVDVAYFCRLFKKTESVTPLGFRKQHRLS